MEFVNARKDYDRLIKYSLNTTTEVDYNLASTVWQKDLYILLHVCNPKIFSYILTRNINFKPATGTDLLDADFNGYGMPIQWLYANTITAIKYGLQILKLQDITLEIIKGLSDFGYTSLDPEFFKFLLDTVEAKTYKPQAIFNQRFIFSLIDALIQGGNVASLEILLERLTKTQIETYNKRKKNIHAIVRELSFMGPYNEKIADVLINLLLIFDYYGIVIFDGSKNANKLQSKMLKPPNDNDENLRIKEDYQAYIDGKYPPYIPPSVKQKVLITELVRQTPGNYMHLLPNELAREIYSHLF